MIVASVPESNIYLHAAKDYKQRMSYILLYGLEVTELGTDRKRAFRMFASAIDHAEECETGNRPIFGE